MSKKTKAPLLRGQSSMLSYITMGKENHNPNAAPALAAPALQQRPLQQRQAVAAPGDVIIIDVDSDLDEDVPLAFACKKAKVVVDDSGVGLEEHVSVGNDFLGSDGSRDPDAKSITTFEAKLDIVDMQYGFSMNIPEFSKVIEYAKECLKEIRPGKTNTILQLKCPVVKKNASGETISLALGGNCPDEKCWSICTVRCADQLFGGKDNLQKFFIFNLRVECRIDEKTGRCAVCSPREAQALGTVYEILCQYAFEIGAKMNYISMAGTSSGIESTLGNWYLKNKCHPDETPYFVNYMPNGYHLSLLSYYCDKFRTVEDQACKITKMVKNISDALGDPALYTSALANEYLPFVINWDKMSNEDKVEMESFWHTLQGRTNLGNYAYMFKIGIFADEYAELRAIWSKEGGERCYELGHGIFDEDHPVLKAAGCTNWGQYCILEGKAIFNPDHPKLKALGVTNFGQWCVLMAKGIFDPAHPKLKALGVTNFGQYCVLMNLGLFDPANAQAVHDGCVKGGNSACDNNKGLFDPANAKAVHDNSVKNGNNARDNNKGIFDPANAKAVHDAQVKCGNKLHDNNKGIFDPANAKAVHDAQVKSGNKMRDERIGVIGAQINLWWSKLPELQEYMRKENSFGFVPMGHSLYAYVRDTHVYYRKTLSNNNAETDEDIRRIIFGDKKLKVLADMGFCFAPPNANSKGACGCRHCTRKHFR